MSPILGLGHPFRAAFPQKAVAHDQPPLARSNDEVHFEFMTRRFLGIASLCFGLSFAHAQQQPEVTLELLSVQNQFLPSEKLPISVRITNHSGRTLKLGQNEEWLTFTVEETKGAVVVRRDDPKVDGIFELESGSRATFKVDIAPHFELTRPGSFKITAQMQLPDLNNLIVDSAPFAFDVVAGSTVWSQTFGVPVKDGANNEFVDRRTYLLQQANYLREVRLYLRIADAGKGFTYAVFPIGPVVSFSKPMPLIDAQARLHVLHQYGMRTYAYHIFSPDGEILERRTYEISDTRPSLRVNESGTVIVIGGVRRADKSDLLPQIVTNAPPIDTPKAAAPSQPKP